MLLRLLCYINDGELSSVAQAFGSYLRQFPTPYFHSTMKFSFAAIASVFLATQVAALPAETAEVRSLFHSENAAVAD